MRLTDIMSAMDLAVYPEVGLVIFLGVFAAIAFRVYGRRRRDEFERFASMALEPEAGADSTNT
jgi:hypothetical protein